nr:hypothetical protein [Bacillota bacterium]
MFPTAQNTDVHRSFSAETVDERVLAAQQGNKEALADIVRLYEPLVRSIVRRMNLSWEDACQEGRLAVVEAVYRFDPAVGCYFGTYVKKRVWGALRTWQRREWRWQAERFFAPTDEEEEEKEDWWERWPDADASGWDDTVWLAQLATMLSPRERLVLEKHIVEGQTLRELATAAGVSTETAKTWKRRALQKLRRQEGQLF